MSPARSPPPPSTGSAPTASPARSFPASSAVAARRMSTWRTRSRTIARHDPSTAVALSMHTHLVAFQVWRHHHGMDAEPIFRKVVDGPAVLVSTGASDWVGSNGTATKVDGGYPRLRPQAERERLRGRQRARHEHPLGRRARRPAGSPLWDSVERRRGEHRVHLGHARAARHRVAHGRARRRVRPRCGDLAHAAGRRLAPRVERHHGRGDAADRVGLSRHRRRRGRRCGAGERRQDRSRTCTSCSARCSTPTRRRPTSSPPWSSRPTTCTSTTPTSTPAAR